MSPVFGLIVLGLGIASVTAINLGNNNAVNNAANLGFPPGTVPTEAVWRSANGVKTPGDVSGTWAQSVDSIVNRHLREGRAACDNIVDELSRQDAASSTFLCRWSCAKGSFSLSIAYQPGTLYSWQNALGDPTLPKSLMVWREACLPSAGGVSPPSAINPVPTNNVAPSNAGTSSDVPNWVKANCDGKRADGRAWQGRDAVLDTDPMNVADMPGDQQTFARSIMAEALNSFNSPKQWTDYVQRKMETKYPRDKVHNSWHVYAGCGDITVWSVNGLRATNSQLVTWFGDVRWVLSRPAWLN